MFIETRFILKGNKREGRRKGVTNKTKNEEGRLPCRSPTHPPPVRCFSPPSFRSFPRLLQLSSRARDLRRGQDGGRCLGQRTIDDSSRSFRLHFHPPLPPWYSPCLPSCSFPSPRLHSSQTSLPLSRKTLLRLFHVDAPRLLRPSPLRRHVSSS